MPSSSAITMARWLLITALIQPTHAFVFGFSLPVFLGIVIGGAVGLIAIAILTCYCCHCCCFSRDKRAQYNIGGSNQHASMRTTGMTPNPLAAVGGGREIQNPDSGKTVDFTMNSSHGSKRAQEISLTHQANPKRPPAQPPAYKPDNPAPASRQLNPMDHLHRPAPSPSVSSVASVASFKEASFPQKGGPVAGPPRVMGGPDDDYMTPVDMHGNPFASNSPTTTTPPIHSRRSRQPAPLPTAETPPALPQPRVSPGVGQSSRAGSDGSRQGSNGWTGAGGDRPRRQPQIRQGGGHQSSQQPQIAQAARQQRSQQQQQDQQLRPHLPSRSTKPTAQSSASAQTSLQSSQETDRSQSGARVPPKPAQVAPKRNPRPVSSHASRALEVPAVAGRTHRSKSIPGKVLQDWSCDAVQAWLQTISVGMPWRGMLTKLDGAQLAQLDKPGLMDLGVTNIAVRLKILQCRDALLPQSQLIMARRHSKSLSNNKQPASIRKPKFQQRSTDLEQAELKADLAKLLHDTQLTTYTSVLLGEGIEDVATLLEYSFDELKLLHIKGGHAKKLLAAAKDKQQAGAKLGNELDLLTAEHSRRLNSITLKRERSNGRLWEVAREKVELGKLLGSGAFGNVHFAVAQDLEAVGSSTKVAAKMLNEKCGEDDKMDFLAEIQVMQQFEPHPNVVSLLGIVTKQEPMMLLVQYMPDGNLRDYLRERRPQGGRPPGISAQAMLIILRDVTNGMDYVTSKRCVHRDLAARNVLLDMSDEAAPRGAIADFGLTRYMNEDYSYLVKTRKRRLPAKWMAPECLEQAAFTAASDVWAYGITIWETVLMGAIPYPGVSTVDLFTLLTEDNFRMPKPTACSEELYKLMHSCWHADPKERPSFAHIRDAIAALLPDADRHIHFGKAPKLERLPTKEEDEIAKDATRELLQYQNWEVLREDDVSESPSPTVEEAFVDPITPPDSSQGGVEVMNPNFKPATEPGQPGYMFHEPSNASTSTANNPVYPNDRDGEESPYDYHQPSNAPATAESSTTLAVEEAMLMNSSSDEDDDNTAPNYSYNQPSNAPIVPPKQGQYRSSEPAAVATAASPRDFATRKTPEPGDAAYAFLTPSNKPADRAPGGEVDQYAWQTPLNLPVTAADQTPVDEAEVFHTPASALAATRTTNGQQYAFHTPGNQPSRGSDEAAYQFHTPSNQTTAQSSERASNAAGYAFHTPANQPVGGRSEAGYAFHTPANQPTSSPSDQGQYQFHTPANVPLDQKDAAGYTFHSPSNQQAEQFHTPAGRPAYVNVAGAHQEESQDTASHSTAEGHQPQYVNVDSPETAAAGAQPQYVNVDAPSAGQPQYVNVDGNAASEDTLEKHRQARPGASQLRNVEAAASAPSSTAPASDPAKSLTSLLSQAPTAMVESTGSSPRSEPTYDLDAVVEGSSDGIIPMDMYISVTDHPAAAAGEEDYADPNALIGQDHIDPQAIVGGQEDVSSTSTGVHIDAVEMYGSVEQQAPPRPSARKPPLRRAEAVGDHI
eukprot:TRINITY_DN12040_c0_g1_i1.p1 TRINITY_DN12040_c0_g1~~TRINITY_DN12040_c0_g1_i1.p1  ORF type:complete len:1509 (+),score=383.91 TRINITY_DN12040_c0_g1_i1:132-4658(+)